MIFPIKLIFFNLDINKGLIEKKSSLGVSGAREKCVCVIYS